MTRDEAIEYVGRVRAKFAGLPMVDEYFAKLLDAAEVLSVPVHAQAGTRWAPTGYTNREGQPLYRCACCGRLTTMPHNANPSLCGPDCAAWDGRDPEGVFMMPVGW